MQVCTKTLREEVFVSCDHRSKSPSILFEVLGATLTSAKFRYT